MIRLYPPMQALRDSDPAAWSPGLRKHHWRHAGGLDMTLDQILPDRWTLFITTFLGRMVVGIPRTHQDSDVLAAVLADLAIWLGTLDLGPRQALSTALAAWLIGHGQCGGYTCTMFSDDHGRIHLSRIVERGQGGILEPSRDFLQNLNAEISTFWGLHPTPGAEFPDTPGSPRAKMFPDRTWQIHLPTSMHARMEIKNAVSPAVRALAFPGP